MLLGGLANRFAVRGRPFLQMLVCQLNMWASEDLLAKTKEQTSSTGARLLQQRASYAFVEAMDQIVRY